MGPRKELVPRPFTPHISAPLRVRCCYAKEGGSRPGEQQECELERSLMIPICTLLVGTGRVEAGGPGGRRGKNDQCSVCGGGFALAHERLLTVGADSETMLEASEKQTGR